MIDLTEQFITRYGKSDLPIRAFFAPGRVNLIGDHIDYCGGLVFPCAIQYGTWLLIRPSSDCTVKLASVNFDLMAVLSESETEIKYGDHWINYPLGVLQQFKNGNNNVTGFECLYNGNLPSAAGLSSSASIEVVTAYALNKLFDFDLDRLALAQLCQRAENEFVGVQCGIMDQMSIALGERGHAMKLNCGTLEHNQVPVQTGEYRLLLVNTNQRRELSESKYNERVTETQEALSLLQTTMNIQQLSDATPEQLETHKGLFANHPVQLQRARHVVSEQARVVAAVKALKAGNLSEFGQLMYQSHDSLQNDYGVSSEPLNLLVNMAREDKHVVGARLTGAGFGGCTVNIVHKDYLTAFKDKVSRHYLAKTGLTATFFPIEPSQGVREVSTESHQH